MLETIIKWTLKLLGQSHLLPFVRGLLHIGRPTDVAFPKELLGQGATLILSGLNNSMAFQSNTDWIWPVWHKRQSDPKSTGFVPTGMNLMTTNVSWRTWTSLGNVASTNKVQVDSVGMVSIGESGWSFFPYWKYQNQCIVPPHLDSSKVNQKLTEGIWPVVETEYFVDDSLICKNKVEVIKIGDDEYCLMEFELDNQGFETKEITMGFSLRPYNPLSVSHIHRIKYKDHLWRINRKAAAWLIEEPHAIRVGDRKGLDPILDVQSEARKKISSRSGIAAGVCEWKFDVAPCFKSTIVLIAIIDNLNTPNLLHRSKPTWNQIEEAKEINRENWVGDLELGTQIHLPVEKYVTAWNAIRLRLSVFDDGTHFSPGTMLYHHFWIRDSAFIAMTHTQLGLHGHVANKLDLLKGKQKSNGYFCSQDGEWDSNGQAIYWMVNHLIATADQEELEKCWPFIKKGAEWIIAQCKQTQELESPHKGLLLAGFSAEHFGPNDHYYWDAWWSLRGLIDAEWAASVLGFHEDREKFSIAAQRLRLDLEKSVYTSFARVQGMGLPSSPYRKVDSASIGNLVAIAPLDVVKLDEVWIKPTIDALWESSMHQGMFFQAIVHTGLNAYLSLQLARAMLAIGDERWERILESVLKHASPTWTWPEAIHPLTGGGCMGDGDHGWAASEFLSFMVSVLVRVQENKLLLGFGVPAVWYDSPQGVSITGVSTRHGTVDWSLKSVGEQYVFQWKIIRNRFQKSVPVLFRLPISLGFSHPRLSAFSEGRSTLVLDHDSGILNFPKNTTVKNYLK